MDRSPLPPPSAARPLILASGSRYRAELLGRLRVPFEAISADVDETPGRDEAPEALAQRLALAKARAVQGQHAERWILGSDQVCACAGRILGKPGSRPVALEQLAWLSGREAHFLTAVALLGTGAPDTHLDVTTVRFRNLDAAAIARYVDAEPALDCAGSFKSEGLGIALCESLRTDDATGLVGLPLTAVRRLLAATGLVIP